MGWLNTTLLAREVTPMEHASLAKQIDKLLYKQQWSDVVAFKQGLMQSGFIWQVSQNSARKKERVCWEGARHILEDQLGFHYDLEEGRLHRQIKFDDKENVAFRNEHYLPVCQEIDRRAYRYVPLLWRVTCGFPDVEIHPSHVDSKPSFVMTQASHLLLDHGGTLNQYMYTLTIWNGSQSQLRMV